MKLTTSKKITKKEVETIVNSESSKSQKMRDLFELGLDVKEIANHLEVRYNFVYNIISRYILEQRIDDSKIEKNSNKGSEFKESVRKLLEENKDIKVSEVSKILSKNYNYCWKIMKELKEEM